MAAPNEVRVNIRRNVLLLKTFTVPQLQAITGLNRQSIYTEIGRMEREGLVTQVGIQDRVKGSSGGRPPSTYQITSDPEKRFEILESVRAFYRDMGEPALKPTKPESKHYFIARELLDKAIRENDLEQEERLVQLNLIEQRLGYARQEEGVGEEDTELVAASLDILEAKAMDALAGDWEQAIRMLDDTRQVSRRLGADDLITEIEDYVRSISSKMVNEQLYCDDMGLYEKVKEIAGKLQIIRHRFGDLIEVADRAKQAERIADKVRQQQASMQVAATRELQSQEFISALNRTQTALVGQVPDTVAGSEHIVGYGYEAWYVFTERPSVWRIISSESPRMISDDLLRTLLGQDRRTDISEALTKLVAESQQKRSRVTEKGGD